MGNDKTSPLGWSAMIFCAGLGTRFKPWTEKHPKALALVNGKSLLQRNVEYLQQYGIRDVIVNVHHFADEIIDAIKKNNGWGSNIIISDETSEVLETGGGLLKAKDLFRRDQKFAIYCLFCFREVARAKSAGTHPFHASHRTSHALD